MNIWIEQVHIEATKYFDEVRAYFGQQTQAGKVIDLVIRSGQANGIPFIGIFDGNNQKAHPLILMINPSGTGWHWENQIGSGVTFHIVNEALLAFDNKKKKWNSINYKFTLNDANDFFVKFMKQVSSFLR